MKQLNWIFVIYIAVWIMGFGWLSFGIATGTFVFFGLAITSFVGACGISLYGIVASVPFGFKRESETKHE